MHQASPCLFPSAGAQLGRLQSKVLAAAPSLVSALAAGPAASLPAPTHSFGLISTPGFGWDTTTGAGAQLGRLAEAMLLPFPFITSLWVSSSIPIPSDLTGRLEVSSSMHPL